MKNFSDEKVCINKKCLKVGELQPLEDFYKYNTRRDKRYAQCKVCSDKSSELSRKKRMSKRAKEIETVCIVYGAEIYC